MFRGLERHESKLQTLDDVFRAWCREGPESITLPLSGRPDTAQQEHSVEKLTTQSGTEDGGGNSSNTSSLRKSVNYRPTPERKLTQAVTHIKHLLRV